MALGLWQGQADSSSGHWSAGLQQLHSLTLGGVTRLHITTTLVRLIQRLRHLDLEVKEDLLQVWLPLQQQSAEGLHRALRISHRALSSCTVLSGSQYLLLTSALYHPGALLPSLDDIGIICEPAVLEFFSLVGLC